MAAEHCALPWTIASCPRLGSYIPTSACYAMYRSIIRDLLVTETQWEWAPELGGPLPGRWKSLEAVKEKDTYYDLISTIARDRRKVLSVCMFYIHVEVAQ